MTSNNEILNKIFEFDENNKAIDLAYDYDTVLTNIIKSVACNSNLYFYSYATINEWLTDIEFHDNGIFVRLYNDHPVLNEFVLYVWKMMLDDYEYHIEQSKKFIELEQMQDSIQDAIDCGLDIQSYDEE